MGVQLLGKLSSLTRSTYSNLLICDYYRNIFSAIASGYIADVIGRKWTILIGLCLSYIGITLEVVATTNEVFFAGKFVNGLSGGMLVTVCVTYVGEVTFLPVTSAHISLMILLDLPAGSPGYDDRGLCIGYPGRTVCYRHNGQ